MKDRLVTLIGGGGFLGRYIAQELFKAGARVRVAERDPRRAYFLKTQGGLGQIQFAGADVRQPDSIARAVAGSDAVVNLAGVFGAEMLKVHVAGAKAAADAAAAAGAGDFVQISAIGADPGSPGAYGRSKAAGEAAVRAAFPQAVIMRPSTVFGPEDQFVNRFAGMMGMPIVPVLRAAVKFQPVYVVDVARAVVRALGDPAARGRTFELGGPDVMTMGEMIRWIAGAVDRHPAIVELPDLVGAGVARAGFLPGAPISWDQWQMLQVDNVVAPGADGLAALGIAPTPLASIAPDWLVRFRRNGRFNKRVATA